MYDAVRSRLEAASCVIARSLVGNFVTSLDMAGCSATVSLLDEEMKRLWDAPVHTAAFLTGRCAFETPDRSSCRATRRIASS